MWTKVPAALRFGTINITSVQGCVSLLIQPQIRKFVFKGLEMTASDFEEGALQAARTVYDRSLESATTSSSDCAPSKDRLERLGDSLAGLCEESLVERIAEHAFPGSKEGGSFTVEVESARFAHMRLVVGGGRQLADTWRDAVDPVVVGDGLVVLARRDAFGDVPAWVQTLLGLRISNDYCRRLMVDHGLAVQFAVDLTCRIVSKGGGDDTAAHQDGHESLSGNSEDDGTGSSFITQQWLLESSTLDPAFTRPPDWRVIDINGSGGWSDFWSAPSSGFIM
mmetsp:Transcript_85464/g.171117  ORF Transcript_85464/g.171117 Transcript_85464/m.171117 type:complete len:280 (+) Transcript_85464:209-1048(+)|eukprot:CAMPEP_0171635398 /NCGR_PEP_ID=MMETSP0990-20121206/26640_1 /TAXON_ID=483369 /ORGANISM="non described non described, Strain CCMP2098" /LENGTH=279 /DNA_ID=CAMNT_0012207029 /DNA_START=153 /DNA_END=992 /DNA_ORIENTATION=+